MKRKKMMPLFAGILSISIVTGCSNNTVETTIDTNTEQNNTINENTAPGAGVQAEMLNIDYKEDDYTFDWKNSDYTTLQLEEGSQTITQSGVYELTGTLADGSVVVDIDKSVDEGTVFIILNDAHIGSAAGTPIHIIDAEKVVLLLEEGTTNTVVQGAIVTEDEAFPSAAIYSKADLTLTGEGSLSVTTAYNDGITSRDDLKITSGNLTIDAAGDGIVGKDLLAIASGTIHIDAGKDGLRTTNDEDADRGNMVITDGTFVINAANDGIQAENSLQIDGGVYTIASGGGYSGVIKVNEGEVAKDLREQELQEGIATRPNGVKPGMSAPTEGVQEGVPARPDGMREGMETPPSEIPVEQADEEGTTESMKGIKAGIDIIINNGDFTISSYEDAIHANGNISILGGNYIINAGDDAVHADEHVGISGGEIKVENSFEGIEGQSITIDDGLISVISTDDGINVFDVEGILTINGGEIYLVSANDGIDSNGDITMTGGEVYIDTSVINERNSAVDSEGVITHTGGTIVDQNGDAIDPTIQKQQGVGMKDNMIPEGMENLTPEEMEALRLEMEAERVQKTQGDMSGQTVKDKSTIGREVGEREAGGKPVE